MVMKLDNNYTTSFHPQKMISSGLKIFQMDDNFKFDLQVITKFIIKIQRLTEDVKRILEEESAEKEIAKLENRWEKNFSYTVPAA